LIQSGVEPPHSTIPPLECGGSTPLWIPGAPTHGSPAGFSIHAA
jgi:hypothetical protein